MWVEIAVEEAEVQEEVPEKEQSDIINFLTDKKWVEENLGMLEGYDVLTLFVVTGFFNMSVMLLISVCACLAKARRMK